MEENCEIPLFIEEERSIREYLKFWIMDREKNDHSYLAPTTNFYLYKTANMFHDDV